MELYRADELDVYEVVDLGQAVGTAYGPSSLLLTGRDGLHVSRMTKRALILGIANTGASVLDLRLTPKRVLVDHLGRQGQAALYVAYRPSRILVTLEGEGADAQAEEVARVRAERAFARAPLSDLGAISLYPNAVDDYVAGLHKRVDYLKDLHLLVDGQNRPVAVLMQPLLESYGMRADLMNDHVTHYREPEGEEAFTSRLRTGDYHGGVRCLEDRLELHRRDGERSTYADLAELLQALESV